jgi:hypothetical protein
VHAADVAAAATAAAAVSAALRVDDAPPAPRVMVLGRA